MVELTIEIELADELKEGDEYAIKDAIHDSLVNLGFKPNNIRVS